VISAADPQQIPKVEKLKVLLKQQSEQLGRGLKVHAALCPDALRPMQEQLESTFFTARSFTAAPPGS
jgi:hypothetical protein